MDDDYYPEDASPATATYQQPPVLPSPYATDLNHMPSPVVVKPRRGRRKAAKTEEPFAEVNTFPSSSSSTDVPSTGGARNVVIKTKFPVARIKRIMQADEDVGKVAQVTPVVVSKALELFMVALCDKASAQARLRNSKRITAGHLKEAVRDEDQFDFLRDIIEKVPNIPDLPTESSHQSNGGDSEDGGAPVKKQRRPRQKKVKDDDAF